MKSLLCVVVCQMIMFNSFGQSDTIKSSLTYGTKGWEFKYGSNYLMQLEWRFQFRTVFVEDDDLGPFVSDNLNASMHIRRARLKLNGHAYAPHIKYDLEYDFPTGNLLNWRLTFAKHEAIQLKVGQWKIEYSTERVISSGKQQMVERSIVNRYFTVDRQMGMMLSGTIFDSTTLFSTYHIGIFNGNGRGVQNDDGQYMLLARYQWNFSRRLTTPSFSDLDRVQKPEGFFALSAMKNKSAYTRFSGSGGGDLVGFEPGLKAQYDIKQLGVELMFKYKGFSLMSENHVKTIDDLANDEQSGLYGGFIMVGYFLSELNDFFPKPLELTSRYALVDNSDKFDQQFIEYSFGMNWFFSGHRNKLTLDYSYLENQDFESQSDNHRFRVQWDISF